MRRLAVANLDDLQLPPAHRSADRRDGHTWILADGREQVIQVRQPVGLGPRDVESRTGHGDRETNPVSGEALHWQRRPLAAVGRDHHRLELAGDRSRLSIPDVVQIPELQREGGPGAAVQEDVNVPGRAIWRGPFVVVEQVNLDRPIGCELVPDGRRILEARVDVVEPRIVPGIRPGLALRLGGPPEYGCGEESGQDQKNVEHSASIRRARRRASTSASRAR